MRVLVRFRAFISKLYKLKVHFTYFYFGQVEIFLQVSDDLFDITLRRQVAEKGNFDPC